MPSVPADAEPADAEPADAEPADAEPADAEPGTTTGADAAPSRDTAARARPGRAGDSAAPGEPCVLLKLGEVVLKGKNRDAFERRLRDNIRTAIRELDVEADVARREGVIVLRVPGGDQEAVDKVARRVTDVMGIARVHRAWRVRKDLDATVRAAIEVVGGHPDLDRAPAFAVRPRRRDKRFPLTSSELAVLIGRKVQDTYDLPVNLSNPEVTVFIEVDQHEVFVFTDGMPGQGGLPAGMSGRGLVLMSGGIDSPVAAYRMIRRGLRCDFLHFSGMPFTGPESVYKAYALVRELDRFQGGSRLFVVPFGKAQQAIKSSGADRLQVVAQRRLMLKTAEAMTNRLGAAALITGDSLGQVSSQTMTNLTALDDAVELPILRPLIGFDKTEIMAEARRIGTLAISELPDEDCCTLLTPRRAETRAKIADLRRIERRLDTETIVEQLLDAVQLHRPSVAS
jgi:tRNA uracil 4-sulfurtransferase